MNTITVKTSELIGPALDWAVAKCEGKILPPEPAAPTYAEYSAAELPITLWETSFRWVKEKLVSVDVSPITVIRIGVLPGCAANTITAVDAKGEKFHGDIKSYFSSQEDAELSAARAMADWSERYKPSSDWSQGGPIIEREDISFRKYHNQKSESHGTYYARICRESGTMVGWYKTTGNQQTGPTPLIAAMRCYVASKLGDTVEIPKELLL